MEIDTPENIRKFLENFANEDENDSTLLGKILNSRIEQQIPYVHFLNEGLSFVECTLAVSKTVVFKGSRESLIYHQPDLFSFYEFGFPFDTPTDQIDVLRLLSKMAEFRICNQDFYLIIDEMLVARYQHPN